MFIYLFQNSCIRPVALSCKRLCFISGMDVINDLCICVLHLKLWMLAMIQGLALQSQGSFFLYKGGILHWVKVFYPMKESMVRNVDEIYNFGKIVERCPPPRGPLPFYP